MRRPAPNLVDLGGRWSFAVSERRIETDWAEPHALEDAGLPVHDASVPGNVELDLLANGLIEDPFVGMNIASLRWLEHAYVYYARTFEAPAPDGSVAVLRFEGLDCAATVYLNGRPVLESDNMLIEHEVCVDGILEPDTINTLVVELHPIMDRARSPELTYPPGLVAEGSGYEGLYLRKAPHMFGWDIMPRALSAGTLAAGDPGVPATDTTRLGMARDPVRRPHRSIGLHDAPLPGIGDRDAGRLADSAWPGRVAMRRSRPRCRCCSRQEPSTSRVGMRGSGGRAVVGRRTSTRSRSSSCTGMT